jgi:hypothetical protein
MLGSGLAVASPREAIRVDGEAALPVTGPIEMGAWLRRLVGRYSFEGVVQVVLPEYAKNQCGPLPPEPSESGTLPPPDDSYCSAIHGKGDCISVGTGPGVQCILDVVWQEIYEVTDEGAFNLPGFVPYMNPAMELFGLDPGRAGVGHLLVDHKGLPESTLGFIKGNRLVFKAPCVNAPVLFGAMKLDRVDDRILQTCERITYIDAKVDSKVVHMSVDIEINGLTFTRIQMTLRRIAVAESEGAATPALGSATPGKR